VAGAHVGDEVGADLVGGLEGGEQVEEAGEGLFFV
jgi:hypothetical protein